MRGENEEARVSGIQAHLKARDVMSVDPVCVTRGTTIRGLAKTLEENQVSGAPVVDRDGRVIGVVSKSDLIRRCSQGAENAPPSYLFEVLLGGREDDGMEVIPESLVCVEDFMTSPALMVNAEASVASVARLMFDKRVHRVIVTDAERFPLGIITSLDVLGCVRP